MECACGGRKTIYGHEGIAAYWRQRFIARPALNLEDLQVEGGAVAVSYRTSRELFRHCSMSQKMG
jgi:hypothetical protein